MCEAHRRTASDRLFNIQINEVVQMEAYRFDSGYKWKTSVLIDTILAIDWLNNSDLPP